MSDVRALIVNRGIVLGDGCYLERAEDKWSPIEAWLRGVLGRFFFVTASRESNFVKRVSGHEATCLKLDDGALRERIGESIQQMSLDGFRDDHLACAFAVIREASRRVLGKRHHDVQLLAGQALLSGKVAEMATGEGKTLAGTLAACTAALVGSAVHVVTVNDYLAERDAQENCPLYDFFGIAVGVVKQDMQPEERRRQYQAQVVYVSNKELTFDYLKDRIAWGGVLDAHLKLRRLSGAGAGPMPILRGLHVAIVDEADSVLVDEARTPLIISETLPDDIGPEVYQQALAFAESLVPGFDFHQGQHRDIWLTLEGEAKLASMTVDYTGVWKSALWQKELVNKALSALHLFIRDQHYIVADNKVQIVDEFTGRVMPDRTWERGLHQMIEAKEGCEITGQRKTLSQITYQRFFGRYLLLAGMTGTAREILPELKAVYDLSGVRIPTHKQSRRERLPDRVWASSSERWEAVAARASEMAQLGRAVLIGTRSVEDSERLGQLFTDFGVNHVVLNARQDKSEADTVASAGQAGRITVATNMAGRGTDIKLSPAVELAGGLHVILTEFHESARVDRQLFGRSARQGNPGSVEAMVCLEDEIFRRYTPVLAKLGRKIWLGVGVWNQHAFKVLVGFAQWKAERHHRRERLETLKRDRKWLQSMGFVGGERK